MGEQIFFQSKNIVISNTLIKTKEVLIPLQSVSRVSVGIRDIRTANIFFKAAFLFLFAQCLSPEYPLGGGLALVAGILGTIKWLSDENDRRHALCITLSSGEKHYILEEIDQAFNAIGKALEK